jgi:hypothetical protein
MNQTMRVNMRVLLFVTLLLFNILAGLSDMIFGNERLQTIR